MSASAAVLPGSQTAPRQTLALLLGVVILFWTLMPIYNMIIVSLQTNDAIFSGNIWPKDPTLTTFTTVFKEDYWYLEDFWVQMLNSLLVGIGTALIVVGVAALASFAITRLRIRFGWLLSNAALLTYVIPASFLAIPFYKIMDGYGLLDNLWSLILVEVTFATPYAIFIFQQYSTSIPRSLEESAKIDGATTPQIFFHIFLPLMMPALVAVGTYALLLAWNEYLYAFLSAVDADQGDRAGGARLLPEQRRVALEPADGGGDRLLDPAARDLLPVPRPDDDRAHDRQRQGLSSPAGDPPAWSGSPSDVDRDRRGRRPARGARCARRRGRAAIGCSATAGRSSRTRSGFSCAAFRSSATSSRSASARSAPACWPIPITSGTSCSGTTATTTRTRSAIAASGPCSATG